MITHHDRLTVIARLRLLDPSQDAQALNRALTAFLSGQPTALIEHTNIPRAQGSSQAFRQIRHLKNEHYRDKS